MSELYQLTATEVVALMRRGEIDSIELVEASIRRIEAVDAEINALPIHCFDRARAQARELSAAVHADNARSLLGLPIAVKDYNDVGGIRTTYGSPIYADNVANTSDATVARLERNGAIPIAKSNVPEWAGGHTFNPIFGITRNPWDTRLSAGGSSGGSAAAVASGSVWLATGNDLGGSLRTPASFNGIVGLRPGPGRVPRGARLPAFDVLWVEGPMARCVSDVALMLDAGAGHAIDDPLSFDDHGDSFLGALQGDELPKRVAFSADLAIVPMAREIADICKSAAERVRDLGAEITDQIPDFTGALDGFRALRAALFATMMGPILADHRNQISPDIVENIERGLNITPNEVFEAERIRSQLYHRMVTFFQSHDLLICPAASVPPFPVEQRYVEEIDGRPCETYIDWFSITFALTMTSCPVVSLPCGFTAEGLPVGIQIVGKPRGEAMLLRVAHRLEKIYGVAEQLPIDPRTPA
ncbi:MAG: amidase family protein [Alphaproteobacteria bacterium]|nr:amidase family protein [Alphaproteobacteria bacterium]